MFSNRTSIYNHYNYSSNLSEKKDKFYDKYKYSVLHYWGGQWKKLMRVDLGYQCLDTDKFIPVGHMAKINIFTKN